MSTETTITRMTHADISTAREELRLAHGRIVDEAIRTGERNVEGGYARTARALGIDLDRLLLAADGQIRTADNTVVYVGPEAGDS